MTMLRFISLCLTIIPLAIAAPTTTINGQLRLPDETPVNATKIVLNSGEFLSYSRFDGTFSFYGVPPGIHLLDVHSHKHHFGQVKIQLLDDQMDSPKCIEYYYPGAPKASIAHPLVMKAHARYEYFEPKGSFNPMSLLKNPMMLMMIVSVGLMFLMPKMMENLEPEERERMQKQMEMQKDPAKMFSSLLGIEEPQEETSKKKRSIKKE
jgi:ER membrane protein complex subunit 7